MNHTEQITVAVIDKGGRGSSLIEKYAQSCRVKKLLAIPGNSFMSLLTNKPVLTFPELTTIDIAEIIKICQTEKVDLVDVAQDNSVEAGLVDALNKVGIATVGPTRLAGEIEWSKWWSREFMIRHGIPQPKFVTFSSAEDGIEYLTTHPNQAWFVKADGLAEGKGALPAENNQEAIQRIKELNFFGTAANRYLLEDWIKSEDGKLIEEFSAFALCDGQNFSIIGYAQDYKRALDHDFGENTGGMGAISQPPVLSTDISAQVEEIFAKTLTGLREEGRPYQGVLYLGGMIGPGGKVLVIEFNARWGDPEAQVLVPSIQNDFVELSDIISAGQIGTLILKNDGKARVVIAGTAKGYPQNYSQVKGKEIYGLEEAVKLPDIHIYGAGVKKVENRWVVDGGRVFYVMGEGNSIEEARKKAYEAIKKVRIEGDNLHYRTDIGRQKSRSGS